MDAKWLRLIDLQTAAASGYVEILKRYCEWNDSNGEWEEDNGEPLPIAVYLAHIEEWFAEDTEDQTHNERTKR